MSNKEERKAPVLRFKGFTDDWEQRKLEDISERINRKNEKLESNLPLTISAQYGLVDQKKFFNKQVASKNLKNYILLKKGEFAYNKSYSKDLPYGAIKRLNLYSQGVISSLYIAFKPVNVNSNFLEQYFNSNKWYKEIYRNAAEGARNHGLLNIAPKDFFSSSLNIPSDKTEQKDISNLLFKLDKLLSLQQRKLDRLLLLKKAYLTNLLPDKTQNPKVRFKEFNDKWKKLKLGNISSISAGGDVNKQKLLKKGRYPVIANALTNKGVIGYYESEYRIQAPAVTVTGRGDIGHAYARKTNFTPVVRLLSVKSKHNVDFLAEAINQKKVPFESTGVPQLTVPKLSNYKILFPSSITEENKIGNFIIKFDEIINLQNKKISSLEQVKNFLLQNMFI